MIFTDRTDTIAAVCTAPGMGAIAVIRISGTDAIATADALWRGKPLADAPSHTAHLGYITDSAGNDIDQAVATVFHAPNSYTGENTVELSCHGSTYIQQAVLNALVDSGVRIALPGEFSQRAFANGKVDLAQAEGIADLIASRSAEAHRLALSQTKGAFSHELDTLRQRLIDLASLIELELDFSEEDVSFADRTQLLELCEYTLGKVTALADSYAQGRVIRDGYPVAIVGAPNAGKSTLLSAISAARPKIADYPFTTMEPSLGIVSYRDGKSFVMADIPGIIEGASEGRGLGLRFLRHIERNAVLLFMVSADTASIKDDYQVLLRELREFNPELNDKSRVLAVTKSDLLDDELREALSQELPDDLPVLFISSVTGDGLTELKDLLWREINSEQNMVASTITHRPLDVRHRVQEEDEFIFETEETDDDLTDMSDEEWNDEFWQEESSVNPD